MKANGVSRRTTRCEHQPLRLYQGDRTQEPHLVHPRRAGDLSARHLHPDPRHRPVDPAGHLFAQCRRHPRHVRHVLRRRARAHDDLCPRHHAVHLGLDHHPAADRGVANPRSPEKGGRERPQEAQSIHPLRHRPVGHGPGLRHLGRDGGDACRSGIGGARSRPVLPPGHGRDPGRRHRISDVARRADHRPRRRQRHLADHLFRHRRATCRTRWLRPWNSAAPERCRPFSSSCFW